MGANKAPDGRIEYDPRITTEDYEHKNKEYYPTIAVFGAQIYVGRNSGGHPLISPMDPHSPERASVLEKEGMIPDSLL